MKEKGRERGETVLKGRTMVIEKERGMGGREVWKGKEGSEKGERKEEEKGRQSGVKEREGGSGARV